MYFVFSNTLGLIIYLWDTLFPGPGIALLRMSATVSQEYVFTHKGNPLNIACHFLLTEVCTVVHVGNAVAVAVTLLPAILLLAKYKKVS